MNRLDFTIPTLGEPRRQSPLGLSKRLDDYIANYVADDQCVLYTIETSASCTAIQCGKDNLVQRAGPRELIYFDPAKVHAAVVTCGGLCPGLNDVIRAVVMTLWHDYGVRRISGVRNGYVGFLPEYGLAPKQLTPDEVMGIHRMGGTVLGSSRGGGMRTAEIVDCLEQMNVNMLFVIGGDGSQRGALAISREAATRGYRISVVGVPKTIDNDLSFVQRSFGFDTAVAEAVRAVSAAHVEASDAINGVGLVKVMGRESGFIAAHTALSMSDVNYVLIPEVPFDLEGESGLLAHLKERLHRRRHAVILVAEGAGQELMEPLRQTDASGNRRLGNIGELLKDRIAACFAAENIPVTIKYIDPSYIIRSAPANPGDSLYCTRLGANAAHAAMAGKTEVLIGLVNGHFVHIPIPPAVSRRNTVDPESSLWRDVVGTTGQPPLMKNLQE